MGYKEKAIAAVRSMMDYDGFRDGDCVSRRAVIGILDMIGEDGPGWTPCSKALPEVSGFYVVWYVCHVSRRSEIRGYAVWEFINESVPTWVKRGVPPSAMNAKAVAWMPLPGPFGEE